MAQRETRNRNGDAVSKKVKLDWTGQNSITNKQSEMQATGNSEESRKPAKGRREEVSSFSLNRRTGRKWGGLLI